MKTFFPYTKGYRQWILLGVACSIAEAVLELELPQVMSDIVDVGIASGDRRYIMMMGLKMLVLALLALLGGVGAAVFAAKASMALAHRCARRSMSRYSASPSPISSIFPQPASSPA